MSLETFTRWGDADRAFGREAAERTAQFVTGPYELPVLDGVGHWIPELAPEALTHLVLQRIRTERAVAQAPCDVTPGYHRDNGVRLCQTSRTDRRRARHHHHRRRCHVYCTLRIVRDCGRT